MSSGKRMWSCKRSRTLALPLALLVATAWRAAAQSETEGFGVPVFPGAEPRPAVADAVEAYYQPGVSVEQKVTTGVYETPAEFQDVYEFYGRRAEAGKWGWRRKTYSLPHQTQTLRFLRAQLLRPAGEAEREAELEAASGAEKDSSASGERLPPVLEPLLGKADLSQAEFESELAELLKENEGASVQVVEGTRAIQGDPAGGHVRITVERPYIDLQRMELVDRTRIVLVKVSKAGS